MMDSWMDSIRIWEPSGAVAAVCVALHGLNDHAGAFAGPAEFFADNGIATLAFDQRGFGSRADRGEWAGMTFFAEEARAAVMHARDLWPEAPICLLGESLGGAVALHAAQAKLPLERLALVGPALMRFSDQPLERRVGFWLSERMAERRWGSKLAIALGLGKATDCPKERFRMKTDPGRIRESWGRTLRGAAIASDAAYRLGLEGHPPILLLHGLKDRIIPPQAIGSWARDASADRVRFAIYRNGWHSLLRDAEREKPLKDTAHWVLGRSGPLPSGCETDRGLAKLLANN